MSFEVTLKGFNSPSPLLIHPTIYTDNRGKFEEFYKYTEFKELGIVDVFCQDNISVSKAGVLRGLHYQKYPSPQGKLVTVPYGEIIDIIVDIRKSSPTFTNWTMIRLSDKDREIVYIPPGYAHGFLSIKDNTVVCYKCTNEYDLSCDAGIRWNDPDIGLVLDYDRGSFILSEKDATLPLLKDAEVFV